MARFMRTANEVDEHDADPKENSETAERSPAKQPDPAQTRGSSDTQPRVSGRTGESTDISVISASLKVTGNLESDAEIRLEGKVEGDVRGNIVTIGESADVTGSVYGETVNLAGTINGKVEGRNVVVSKTARSTGDIIHESLQIESGAYVDGHCRPQFGMSESKNARTKPAAPISHQEDDAAEEAPAPTSAAGQPAKKRSNEVTAH